MGNKNPNFIKKRFKAFTTKFIMKKILITGGDGQLSKQLFLELSNNFEVISLSKNDLNITDKKNVKNAFKIAKSISSTLLQYLIWAFSKSHQFVKPQAGTFDI